MNNLRLARTDLNTKMVNMDSDVNLLIDTNRVSTLAVATTLKNTLNTLISTTKTDVSTMIGTTTPNALNPPLVSMTTIHDNTIA